MPYKAGVSMSNYGNHTTCVDIWAPGEDVASTDVRDDYAYKAEITGTSFSTPQVAGAAALKLGDVGNNIFNLPKNEIPAAVQKALLRDATHLTAPGAKFKWHRFFKHPYEGDIELLYIRPNEVPLKPQVFL